MNLKKIKEYKNFLFLSLFMTTNVLSADSLSMGYPERNVLNHHQVSNISVINPNGSGYVFFPMSPFGGQILFLANKNDWKGVRALYEGHILNGPENLLTPKCVKEAYAKSLFNLMMFEEANQFHLNCTAFLEEGKEFTCSNGRKMILAGSDLIKANEIIAKTVFKPLESEESLTEFLELLTKDPSSASRKSSPKKLRRETVNNKAIIEKKSIVPYSLSQKIPVPVIDLNKAEKLEKKIPQFLDLTLENGQDDSSIWDFERQDSLSDSDFLLSPNEDLYEERVSRKSKKQNDSKNCSRPKRKRQKVDIDSNGIDSKASYIPPRIGDEYQVLILDSYGDKEVPDEFRMGELMSSPEKSMEEIEPQMFSRKIIQKFNKLSIESSTGGEYFYLANLFHKGQGGINVDLERALDLYKISLTFLEVRRGQERDEEQEKQYNLIKERIASINGKSGDGDMLSEKVLKEKPKKKVLDKKRPAEKTLEKKEIKKIKSTYVDENKEILETAFSPEARDLHDEAVQNWSEGNSLGAFQCYKKASELGHLKSTYTLGRWYLEGINPCSVDHNKAYSYFKKAAKEGDAQSLFSLAYYHDKGTGGIEQNFKLAFTYYTQAEAAGSDEAICNIGVLYENGDGVAPSQERAVTYYKRASAKGVARAQYYLGLCYESGLGIDKNLEEARYYFELAAKQGYEEAIEALRTN